MVQKSAEAFRTISEVADLIEVPQHVLRFWETKFTHIKPLKRAGGRRFYRPADVELIKGIQSLLYGDGYTIKGVQKILKDQGVRYVIDTGKGGTATRKAKSAPVDLETGKAELPISNVAPPSESRTTSAPIAGLGEAQKKSLTSVLNDLVALKAQVIATKADARLEEEAPLLARAAD
jgi:DNA-binding transcriptional MerR regulator